MCGSGAEDSRPLQPCTGRLTGPRLPPQQRCGDHGRQHVRSPGAPRIRVAHDIHDGSDEPAASQLTERVVIDLTDSHIWDASTVAITTKYKRMGKNVEIIG